MRHLLYQCRKRPRQFGLRTHTLELRPGLCDSRAEWNRYLGRIEVKGGTEAQQTKFYTDLWHVLLGRHKIDDANGCYPDYTDGTRQGSQTVNVKYHTRTLPKNNQGRDGSTCTVRMPFGLRNGT